MQLKKLAPLTFIITGRNKRYNSQMQSSIYRDIHKLNLIFKDVSSKVYLVGGIGMAIRKNHFYRNHRDLDIAIFTEDMVSFFEQMKVRGYRIIQKYVSGHISPKHNLQVGSDISVEEVRKSNPDKLKLRLLRSGPSRFKKIGQRTEYFDVFLLGKTQEGVLMHGYNAFTPWTDFYPIYPVIEGEKLLLPNINYKRYLYPQNKKEIMDFRMAGLIPA